MIWSVIRKNALLLFHLGNLHKSPFSMGHVGFIVPLGVIFEGNDCLYDDFPRLSYSK
jgi:hypothetical protein